MATAMPSCFCLEDGTAPVPDYDHLHICGASPAGKLSEQVLPDAAAHPTYKAIVDRRRRSILGRAIALAATGFQDMNDAADHTSIIGSLDTTNIRRQMRFNPFPLLVAQPKWILAHDPAPFQKRIRIVLSAQRNLMSSDLSPSSVRCDGGSMSWGRRYSGGCLRWTWTGPLCFPSSPCDVEPRSWAHLSSGDRSFRLLTSFAQPREAWRSKWR